MPGSSAQSSLYPGGMIGGAPQYSQASYMSHPPPPPPGREHMVRTLHLAMFKINKFKITFDGRCVLMERNYAVPSLGIELQQRIGHVFSFGL